MYFEEGKEVPHALEATTVMFPGVNEDENRTFIEVVP
jgi:hypothetical protein